MTKKRRTPVSYLGREEEIAEEYLTLKLPVKEFCELKDYRPTGIRKILRSKNIKPFKRGGPTEKQRASAKRTIKKALKDRWSRPITDHARRSLLEGKLAAKNGEIKPDLSIYDDIEKFYFLRRSVFGGASPKNTKLIGKLSDIHNESWNTLKNYIDYFYWDSNFNKCYSLYLDKDKNPLWVPSIDHKLPIQKGGTHSLENLWFIPVFVNRLKWDLLPEDWNVFIDSLDSEFLTQFKVVA